MFSKTTWSSEAKRECLHGQCPPSLNLCVFLDKLCKIMTEEGKTIHKKTLDNDHSMCFWHLPMFPGEPWPLAWAGFPCDWRVNILLQQENNWELKRPELEMIQGVAPNNPDANLTEPAYISTNPESYRYCGFTDTRLVNIEGCQRLEPAKSLCPWIVEVL